MPLEVFYSYSHEDEKLRDKLEKQLSLLQRRGLIVSWHDRRIGAGQEWREQIDAHVRSAHIILLLVSADFIASDYCYGVEMQIALERQGKHEAVVIPVILRTVDWSSAPFAHLQAVPRDGKPVTKWDDEDEAFADVARGIREVVARFHPSAPGDAAVSPSLLDRFIPKPRVVDAAIPSHIVKELGTRLLVLIRLPDSPGLRGILQTEEDDEARPKDVRSRPFNMVFPLGPAGKPEPLKVTVKLTSPDFSPPEQAKNVFVPPEADSEVCPFMLTPKRIGRLTVLVELQWEDAVRGHRSLLTKCVAEATDVPVQAEMNVVQMHMAISSPSAVGALDDLIVSQYAPPSGVSEPPDDSYKSSPLDRSVDSPYPTRIEHPASPAPSTLLAKPVLVALISAILIGCWIGYRQVVSRAPQTSTASPPVIFTGQVLNARTREFVPDVRITVVLDGGAGPFEQYTDSHGNFSFHLDNVKRGTQGRIYLNAPNYGVVEKNFVITDFSMHDELRLEPSQNIRSQPNSAAAQSSNNDSSIPDAFVGKWQGKIFNKDADPHGNHGNVEATYTIRKDSTMTVYVKEFPPAQNVTASYDGEGLSYTANTGIGARPGYLAFNADRKTLNVRVPRTSGDPPGDTLMLEGTLTRQ
jgi:hypothetical protein